MNKKQGIERIQYLLSDLRKIGNTEPETESWFKNAKLEIKTLFGENSEAYKNIVDLKFSMSFKNLSNKEQFENNVLEAEKTLSNLQEFIHFHGLPDIDFGFYSKDVNAKTLIKILLRFPAIEWIKTLVPIIIAIILYTLYLLYGIKPK